MRCSFSLVLFLLCSVLLTAQDQARVDSLKQELSAHEVGDTMRLKILAKLWRAYKYNDLDIAATYGRQMVEEAKDLPDKKWIAAGHQCFGSTLDYQGKTDSALYHYWSALAIYNDQGPLRLSGVTMFNISNLYLYINNLDSTEYYLQLADSCFTVTNRLRELSAVSSQRAIIARHQGRFDDGLEHALRSLSLAEEMGDSLAITDATNEIGLAYDQLGNYPEAIRYLKRNVAWSEKSFNYFNQATDLVTLATIYQSAKQLDSAFHYMELAETLIDEKGFFQLKPMLGFNLGSLHRENGSPLQALRYLRMVEKHIESDEQGVDYGQSLKMIAEILLEQGDSRQAKDYALKAFPLYQEAEDLRGREAIYRLLSRIEQAIGDSPKALDYLWRASNLKDSLNQVETMAKVAELTSLFEKEKQDRLISEQKSRLALLESNAHVDRLQRNGLIAGLIGLLALLAFAWYSFRQRNLRLQTEREQLAVEVKTHQRELSAHALQMAQKGQLLDQLGEELRQIKGEHPDDRKKLNGLLRELGSEERIDQDWANFRNYFQGVHGNFEDRLKSAAEQTLSPRELRLAALIKMQLNNQEVGAILSTSQDSLYKAKYRLRKKLPKAGEGELDQYIREL